MDFEEFMQWATEVLLNVEKEFQTLGRRARFRARYNKNGSITIRNSKNKKYTLNNKSIKQIFERYEAAPPAKRHRFTYYEIPEWPETPSTVAAGYTAAIIRYWDEKGGKAAA